MRALLIIGKLSIMLISFYLVDLIEQGNMITRFFIMKKMEIHVLMNSLHIIQYK